MADLQTLGRYKLQRRIASSATGEVYEALDPKLERPVAIKTILKSYLNEEASREYSARFKEEAQAVARLDHPNIVQVHDFGEEGQVAFVVMTLIRGKDLKQCFDSSVRFEPKEVVRMMCELLGALDSAHRSGIVHRDIKPSNVPRGAGRGADEGPRRRPPDRRRAHRPHAGRRHGRPGILH